MKGFSQFLMVASGVAVAPFLVTFISEFFEGGPEWLPFLIALLVGGVLYAVGVVRGAAIGLLASVVVYAALLVWYREGLSWMPPNVRSLEGPF